MRSCLKTSNPANLLKLYLIPLQWSYLLPNGHTKVCMTLIMARFLSVEVSSWGELYTPHTLQNISLYSYCLEFYFQPPKTWHCQHFSLFSVCLIKLVTFLTEIYLHHFKIGSLPFFQTLSGWKPLPRGP